VLSLSALLAYRYSGEGCVVGSIPEGLLDWRELSRSGDVFPLLVALGAYMS